MRGVKNEHLKIIVRKLFDDKVGWVLRPTPLYPSEVKGKWVKMTRLVRHRKSPARSGAKDYLLAFFLMLIMKSLSSPSNSISNIFKIFSLYLVVFSVSESAVR